MFRLNENGKKASHSTGKLQLMEAISKMLLEEESPENYVDLVITYPLFTVLAQEKAATQLQQYLDQRQITLN